MIRRTFLKHAVHATAGTVLLGSSARGAEDKVGRSFRSERREIRDPKTGRRLIQLTAGDSFDMPMYYYIPTFGSDGKTIVFQRYNEHSGEVQLYKIHIDNGETVQL